MVQKTRMHDSWNTPELAPARRYSRMDILRHDMHVLHFEFA